jgi:hypothetical protein
MNTIRNFPVALLTLIFTASIAQAEDYLFTFNDSIPPEFTIGGNGTFSQSLNSSIVYTGINSLQITTSRGFGPNYAGTGLAFDQPIERISFAIYDQYAGSAPFYMYFGLGPTIMAWQDAGLSDDVLIYGGSAVPTPRTVGWHTVEAVVSNNVITYSYDGSFLGTYTATEALNITNAGWTVDSAGGGTYSIYIDDVAVQTVPEPTINVLLIIAATLGVVVIFRNRRRC